MIFVNENNKSNSDLAQEFLRMNWREGDVVKIVGNEPHPGFSGTVNFHPDLLGREYVLSKSNFPEAFPHCLFLDGYYVSVHCVENLTPYSELQERSGLKKGDKVKIVSKCPTLYRDWRNSWVPDMDELVGKVKEVSNCSSSIGVSIDFFEFPYFCLERVEEPAPVEVQAEPSLGNSEAQEKSQDVDCDQETDCPEDTKSTDQGLLKDFDIDGESERLVAAIGFIQVYCKIAGLPEGSREILAQLLCFVTKTKSVEIKFDRFLE